MGNNMRLQRRMKIRRFLACLLLAVMVFQSTGVTGLMETWAKSSKAGRISSMSMTATPSGTREWDYGDGLEIEVINDLIPGWERTYKNNRLASPTNVVASPSNYTYTITAEEEKLHAGSSYLFSELADYEIEPEVEPEYEDSFRLMLLEVLATGSNASRALYEDSSGSTEYIPAMEEIDVRYAAEYIMEYWSENEEWEAVEDSSQILIYRVVEQRSVTSEYEFTIASTTTEKILTIGDNYDLG